MIALDCTHHQLGMRSVFRFVTLLIALIVAGTLPAQAPVLDAWTGNYTGRMVAGTAKRPADTVDVTFTFTPLVADSLWAYTMVFDSERYGVVTKDYYLRAASLGDTVNFQLDERNGIVMDQTLMNDAFYGLYTLLGMTYVTTLRRLPDGTLLWDLFGVPESTRTMTSTPGGDGEEPIEVVGGKATLQQTVYLKRRE